MSATPPASGRPPAAESPAARPAPTGIPTTIPAIKFYPFTSWRTEGSEQVSEVAAPTGMRLAVHVREETDGHFRDRKSTR